MNVSQSTNYVTNDLISGGIGASTPHQPSGSVPQLPAMNPGNEKRSAAIKHLEASLAVLPEGDLYAASRNAIWAQIMSLKSAISKSKPLPAQLAAASAAFERAICRRNKALEAVEKASKELALADEGKAKVEADLRRIEGEMAASAATSPEGNCDNIQKLASSLSGIINEMKVSHNVPEELIGAAETSMTKLFNDVQAVAAIARSNASARSGNDGNDSRSSVKRSSSSPPSPEHLRNPKISGKTPVAELAPHGHLRVSQIQLLLEPPVAGGVFGGGA